MCNNFKQLIMQDMLWQTFEKNEPSYWTSILVRNNMFLNKQHVSYEVVGIETEQLNKLEKVVIACRDENNNNHVYMIDIIPVDMKMKKIQYTLYFKTTCLCVNEKHLVDPSLILEPESRRNLLLNICEKMFVNKIESYDNYIIEGFKITNIV